MKKLRLLSFLLCAALLISCSPVLSDTESEVTDDTVQTDVSDDIVLVKDGKAVYDIVYPKLSRFANVESYAEQIRSSFETYTGVKPISYDDSVSKRSEYLILCGDTSYDESVAENLSLGKGGYSVCMSGNYIIITASDDLSMVKAVNWFCNTLLKRAVSADDGKTVTLAFEQNRSVGELAELSLNIGGKPLSSYSIIYPSNDDICKEAATSLSSVISSQLGVTCAFYPDSKAASENEILVGKTNRIESQNHSTASNVRPSHYEYAVIGTKLSILGFGEGGDGSGLAIACSQFVNNLVTEKATNLEDNFMLNGQIKLNDDSFKTLSSGADVRVMTANILSEEWGGTECMPRAEIFYANLEYYSPDVIGAQEVSINWTNALEKVLAGSDYTLMYPVVDGTDSNYCPIIYNTKTLDVIESGAYRLAIGGPAKARTVTWAVFAQKETGEKFAVLNTHLDWIADANDYETTGAVSHYSREMQVRELAGTYADVEAKYPEIPIIMTADWNTAKGAHPLNILTDLTGVVFTQDIIANNDWGQWEVDHILVKEGTSVVNIHCYYENGRDLGATDHPWGFADIKLK